MANQYRSVLASGGASTGGDALPAEVLAGKTFTNDNGAQTGTMVNNGAVSQTLSAGQSYTIPEGYHNGSGTVTASATLNYHYYSNSELGSLSNNITGIEANDMYIYLERGTTPSITLNGSEVTPTVTDSTQSNYYYTYHLTNISVNDILHVTAWNAVIAYV